VGDLEAHRSHLSVAHVMDYNEETLSARLF